MYHTNIRVHTLTVNNTPCIYNTFSLQLKLTTHFSASNKQMERTMNKLEWFNMYKQSYLGKLIVSIYCIL